MKQSPSVVPATLAGMSHVPADQPEQPVAPAAAGDLRGRCVIITRPAGTASALARRVQALGGVSMLLPGSSLRKVMDSQQAKAELCAGLNDELVIFSSPAAVRFAAALMPLRSRATILAVGAGTARALRRAGVAAPLSPARQDSEGLLDQPLLQAPMQGRRVSLVGAPGGRGLLARELARRGAKLRQVHVYRREPPRLDRRHLEPLSSVPDSALLLLSSGEALHNLCCLLPPPALARLRQTMVIVSSARLEMLARAAGFTRTRRAGSALAEDLLSAAVQGD